MAISALLNKETSAISSKNVTSLTFEPTVNNQVTDDSQFEYFSISQKGEKSRIQMSCSSGPRQGSSCTFESNKLLDQALDRQLISVNNVSKPFISVNNDENFELHSAKSTKSLNLQIKTDTCGTISDPGVKSDSIETVEEWPCSSTTRTSLVDCPTLDIVTSSCSYDKVCSSTKSLHESENVDQNVPYSQNKKFPDLTEDLGAPNYNNFVAEEYEDSESSAEPTLDCNLSSEKSALPSSKDLSSAIQNSVYSEETSDQHVEECTQGSVCCSVQAQDRNECGNEMQTITLNTETDTEPVVNDSRTKNATDETHFAERNFSEDASLLILDFSEPPKRKVKSPVTEVAAKTRRSTRSSNRKVSYAPLLFFRIVLVNVNKT